MPSQNPFSNIWLLLQRIRYERMEDPSLVARTAFLRHQHFVGKWSRRCCGPSVQKKHRYPSSSAWLTTSSWLACHQCYYCNCLECSSFSGRPCSSSFLHSVQHDILQCIYHNPSFWQWCGHSFMQHSWFCGYCCQQCPSSLLCVNLLLAFPLLTSSTSDLPLSATIIRYQDIHNNHSPHWHSFFFLLGDRHRIELWTGPCWGAQQCEMKTSSFYLMQYMQCSDLLN